MQELGTIDPIVSGDSQAFREALDKSDEEEVTGPPRSKQGIKKRCPKQQNVDTTMPVRPPKRPHGPTMSDEDFQKLLESV